jgi:hypothetical protein
MRWINNGSKGLEGVRKKFNFVTYNNIHKFADQLKGNEEEENIIFFNSAWSCGYCNY